MSGCESGVAVISGGGSGIGREIALALAGRGYALALLGRRNEPLEATLEQAGGRGLALPCDVRDAAAVAEFKRRVLAEWPAVDLLVPAAGVAELTAVEETSPESFANQIETNLTGTFLLLRAFLPGMKERGRGWIFPVLSVAARQGFPQWGAYCASKWGVAGLVAALRAELAGTGIRITTLFPGATATSLWDHLAGAWDREAMIRPGEVARAILWALDGDESAVPEEIHLAPAGGAL